MKSNGLMWLVVAILVILVLVPGVRAETYGYVTEFGGYGTGDGKFFSPAGVAVNSSDYVYVVDYMQNRVQVFTSDGTYVTQWGSTGSGDGNFSFPWGVAVNRSHLVYVADQNYDRVQVFDPTGRFLFKWGSTGLGNGEFLNPWAIAVNSSGFVYVSDYNRIQVFSPVGTFVTQRASSGSGDGEFNGIQGLAVDTAGNVYVTEYYNHRVQKFTPGLAYVTKWGSPGSDNGQFNYPRGVAVDAAGNVYVADSYNNRIQKFASDGTYVTKWGSYGFMGGQFYLPDGIAVDSSGDVWVGDASDRIQKFALIPITLEAAGDYHYYFGEDIKFWGDNTETPTAYLFITGPGLPAQGAQMSADPKNSGVTDNVASSFTLATVLGDNTWEWKWFTTENIPLDPGNYTVYAVAEPRDKDHLAGVHYATLSILIEKPWISATVHPSIGPVGTVFTFTGTKQGGASPAYYVNIFVTNATPPTPFQGSLPANGVRPDDFSVESISGDGSTFVQATVNPDRTWQYDWDTSTISGGSLLPGSRYGFVCVMYPLNMTDASPYYTKLGIGIEGPVHADYVVDKTYGTKPLTVEFTDISTGIPKAVNLSFGDGIWANGTYSLGSVTHTYTNEGMFIPVIYARNSVSSDSGTNATISVSSAPIPVTCEEVISLPGVYELQNDCANTPFAHPWDGITIASSNVVFDGMGHTIDGMMDPWGWTDVHGVNAYTGSALSNIIVKNVTVNGTYQGIYYYQVNNGRIENITGRNDWSSSIFLIYSDLNAVTNCTATNDGGYGIGVWEGSDSNTVTDNIVSNSNYGFSLSANGQNNVISNNTFENNHVGIDLYGASSKNNYITGNIIRKNTGYGINIDIDVDSNFIYDNYFSNDVNTNFVGIPSPNTWNMPPGTPGPNIIGGSLVGGNYWATPAGTGFSQTCTDADHNGICDSPYDTIATGNIDNLPLKTLTTPDEAADYVKDNYVLTGKVLYVSKDLVLAKSKVHTWGYKSTHTMPDKPGYLTFIDDNPDANWEHPARIVHVEDKKVAPATTEYNVWSPPNDVSLSYNGGLLSDPGGDTLIPPEGPPVCTPDCGHYYALLLSGGVQKEANYARYRNDIAFMYQTLTQKYGYPKDHITVLMSDGRDPGYDQLIAYDTNNNPVYADSNTDLDYVRDGISDVKDVPATRTNVLQTLAELRSSLTTDDNLFIFTTNHGGTTTADPANKDVILYLWGTDAEGWITDADFVSALPGSPQYPDTGVKSITMVMEQCFGGGFIDNFIDTSPWNTQKRVIATAANFNEYSWGNAYSFNWISGEWFDRLSMEDAHNNAHDYDRYHTQFTPPLENPQFFSTPDAGTTQFLADCPVIPPTPPSITVDAPKADTWYTGQTRDITWTQTELSGKKVNIELWKGTATAKTQDIVPPSTVDATTGTQKWTIPTTLTAARDYYIKIYQSDALEVFGRSAGALTIIRSSGAGTGKLWVNSTPVPNPNEPGAMIYIEGVLQKDATGANILTNALFTQPAGSLFVGVDRTGYYPVPASQVKVPQGGTVVLKFQLEPIITDQPNDPKNDCVPYGTMEIRSTPEQDAKITILDQDTGKEITGLFTDTTTKIAPGTYTVTVEHDRYLTAKQTDVIIRKPACPAGEERAVSVDFELQPTEDVPAIVKIVPRSLNLASKGYFMAFVTLPTDYKAADVIAGSIVCEGATAVKLVRHKLFPRTFVAIFRRSDLVDVPTGNSVPMTVEGSIKQTNGNPVFSGTDKIKVISNKVTSKEDVDDWQKMTDEKVFSQFNPGYSKDDEKVFSQSNQKNDNNNQRDNGQSNQKNDRSNGKDNGKR